MPARLKNLLTKTAKSAMARKDNKDYPEHFDSALVDETGVAPLKTIVTRREVLEANRIISFQPSNPIVATFDILRTKTLQDMDEHGWQVVIITSPTSACGKTVTALNLAISIARQPDRQVVLVDLDLRKPRISQCLGFSPAVDLVAALKSEASLRDAMVHIDVAGPQLVVLPTRTAVRSPSEIILSQETRTAFETLRDLPQKPTIIVDMPPLLVSDDVLAFLPIADCCILAVAEGVSTAREISSSERMLSAANYLGCVLTMSSERLHAYY